VTGVNFYFAALTQLFFGGKCSTQLDTNFDKTPKKFHQVCTEKTLEFFQNERGIEPFLATSIDYLVYIE
jgi:hypothetical protein